MTHEFKAVVIITIEGGTHQEAQAAAQALIEDLDDHVLPSNVTPVRKGGVIEVNRVGN